MTTLHRPWHDPDQRNFDGHTALSVAALAGAFDCICPLLSVASASVHLARKPPVLHASIQAFCLPCAQNELELEKAVSLLVEHGADPNEQDDDWMTPLHHAASIHGGHGDKIMESLLENGAAQSVDVQDRNGRTPLHAAVSNSCTNHVYTLIHSTRTSLTITDAGTRTPLHIAAREGASDCYRVIINAASASPEDLDHLVNLKDRHGRTALDLAEAAHSEVFRQQLRQIQAGREKDSSDVGCKDAETKPTLVVAPPECLQHHTTPPPPGPNAPPENVRRLQCLVDDSRGVLRAREFTYGIDSVGRQPVPLIEYAGARRLAALGDVLRVHDWPYAKKLQSLCQSGIGNLDTDTHLSPGSYKAALAGAQAIIGACEEVTAGQYRNAFCAVRPPGHHAGPRGSAGCSSHGFCLISNAAVGAAHARSVLRHHGIQKVAVVDFDVHHGNGTQACFEATQPDVLHRRIKPLDGFVGEFAIESAKPILDPEEDRKDLLFASVHGYDGSFYPGTGATTPGLVPQHEREDWAKDGVMLQSPENETEAEMDSNSMPRTINVGMYGKGPKQERSSKWRRVWKGLVLPEVFNFDPDLIIISAGFDAHMRDSLQGPVNLGVRESDYEWLTEEIVKLAHACCDGRVVSALEGGYKIQGNALSHFARSVQSHVRALQRPAREEFDPDMLKNEVLDEWETRRGIEIEEERKWQEQMLEVRSREEEMRQIKQEEDMMLHGNDKEAQAREERTVENREANDGAGSKEEPNGGSADDGVFTAQTNMPPAAEQGIIKTERHYEEPPTKRMRTNSADWNAVNAQIESEDATDKHGGDE